ncbi:MAG: GNAT family N-acetyltransferase [Lachnospiraceae bacterium]|jgi:RimJ/RimL family protein N-acetyltransferase|nr:GNAT family N-acetyltransferase [Lachnospiraceae bacterium]
MNGPFVAENGPLLLRPMEEKDCADIVRWRNEERVRKWYIYRETFTQEGERDYFRNVVQTGKAHIFMICGKENPDRAVGCCVINNIDESANEAESGLFIGEESALGKGYGSLALDACAAYAFKKWGYGRLTARVFTDNVPSLETHRKAGYAILKRLPGVVCTDADVRDMYLLERKNPSADSCRDLPAGEEEKNAGAEAAAGQDGKRCW